MMNAYYSKKQSKKTGEHFIYMGEDGLETIVSQVGGNPPNFDDVIDMGKVTKFLRVIEHN